MYGREGKDFTLSVAGDAIINRRISTCEDQRLLDLVKIIRDTDIGFVNLETLLYDFEGYPNAQCGGMYLRSPKYIANELEWMGFNIFAAANNHSADYGRKGMITTMNALEERNLTYTGIGRNLREARSPSYMDNPAGNVALVACCSTFHETDKAGEQRPDMEGRPGLSPLSLKSKFIVNSEWFNKIKELSESLGLEDVKEDDYRKRKFPVPGEEEEGFTFINPKGNNLNFVEGDKNEIKYEIKEKDEKEIKRELERANKLSDWVLFSLHYHVGKDGHFNDRSIPQFVKNFAHDCIEAGVDVFLGHGSHVMRGIEIYKGKPIFYGLGNFFFQTCTVDRLPADMYEDLEWFPIEKYDLGHENVPTDVYDVLQIDEDGNRRGFPADKMFWECVLPVIKFVDGKLKKITLYPLILGREEPRSRRGRPLLAEGEKAISILEEIRELSEEFGTEINIEEEKGIIEIE